MTLENGNDLALPITLQFTQFNLSGTDTLAIGDGADLSISLGAFSNTSLLGKNVTSSAG